MNSSIMTEVKRLFDLPHIQLRNYPNERMFVSKLSGHWVPVSTSAFLTEVMQVSRGLIAMGIQPMDKVAIVSETRYEWNVMDIAIQQVAAIVVPIYPNISESDYRYIFNDAAISLCVVSGKELAGKINSIKGDVPSLRKMYTMETVAGEEQLDALKSAGKNVAEEEVMERMKIPKNEDMATIIYTSGTTGKPKGVMLSHNNILSNVLACEERIPADKDSRVLTFLPVCHIYERMLQYLYIHIGCSIHFAVSLDTIGENIKEVRPHVFTAVPRLIEKVFDKIIAKGDELKGFKHSLFFWAVRVGEKYDPVKRPFFYNIKLWLARKLIFKKWQEALGGEVRAIASGSAALQPRLARIFLAADIPILEGYGLTETSPVVSVNSFDKGIRIGTVGPLITGVEVKIAEDGEILVKGPNVMLGYYNMPEETNEVIKAGWFHTGDIGEFVEGKFLKITDRKKEMFKTSGGKYIAPQVMENRFKESRFIEQMIVIGNNEKFPSALIVPGFSYLKEWSQREGLGLEKLSHEELIANEEVIKRIKQEVESINQEFGNWEMIKKFKLLPHEFTIEGGELTPTLKLKRKVIMEKYSDLISKIYH